MRPAATSATMAKTVATNGLFLFIPMPSRSDSPLGTRPAEAAHSLVEPFSLRIRLRLCRRLRPCLLIPVFTHQADGSGVCETDLFCKNPATELFPKNHAQQPKQGDNGRRRALDTNQ